MFDDTLLDDPDALLAADTELRRIAESGARVRRETDAAAEQLTMLDNTSRPRAIVAAGSGGRLLRAVLEPSCPVPFVAWSGPGLPGWAGPLDLVVIAAPGAVDRATSAAAAPPTPLKSATSCGIWVMATRRAAGTPMTLPIAIATRMGTTWSRSCDRNTTTHASTAPTAPSRLPRRAVAGEDSPFSARMKQTAATR